MEKRQWYKPWYIWFGLFAFLILTYHSLHIIDKYETKLKIGYPSQRDLARKVRGNIFFFSTVLMVVPTMAIVLLVYLLFGDTEHFLLESLYIVYIYPIGVYATYRHVLWRDEYISHLMKPKKNKK